MGRPAIMPGEPTRPAKLQTFTVWTYAGRVGTRTYRETREVRQAADLLALGAVWHAPLTWYQAGPGHWRGFEGRVTLRVEIIEGDASIERAALRGHIISDPDAAP